MQAVADAHVLEVAKPGVEGDERLLGRLAFGGAFPEQSRFSPPLQDERGDGARASRIEPLRLGEFVEQPFELEGRAVRPCGDQRRRQMADRRRADAPLGLRRLAGIVDDERVDDGRRAEHDFGRAALAERDRLPRQPLERAVRAELNDRVDFLFAREPEMKRDIGMARRELEIVVIALARRRVAAVGLHRDDELAEPHEAEPKRAVDQVRVFGGLAPRGDERSPEVRRSRKELGLVFGERQRRLELSFGQRGDQRGRIEIASDVISRGAQGLADGDRARGRIEPNRIAGAPAAGRVIRQHASEALVPWRLAPEIGPAASEFGDKSDAVGERLMRYRAELGPARRAGSPP